MTVAAKTLMSLIPSASFEYSSSPHRDYSAQTLPIGRYAQVCYRGCDVEKWLLFGSRSALVTMLRRGMALCRLDEQQLVWVPLGDLERVPP